jgi:hypothetical protein
MTRKPTAKISERRNQGTCVIKFLKLAEFARRF